VSNTAQVRTAQTPDVGLIMEYEAGDLSAEKTLELFSSLIKSGMAWSLQGHYGRTATALIEAGWLSREGEILKHPDSVEASKRTAAIEELAPVENRESAIQQTLSHSHTVGMGVAPGASLKETYPEVIHPGAGRVPTRASVDPGAIADWILQAVSYPNRLYTDVQAAFDGMCNPMQETFGKWASPDQKRRVANILRGMGFLVKYEGEKIESYAPPEVRGDVNVYPRGPVGLPPEFAKKASNAEAARALRAGYELGLASFNDVRVSADAGNDAIAVLVKDLTADGFPPFEMTEKGVQAAIALPKIEFLRSIAAALAKNIFSTSAGIRARAGSSDAEKAAFTNGVNAGITFGIRVALDEVSSAEKDVAGAAWKTIRPIFEAKLKEIAEALGVQAEVDETTDEEYAVSLFIDQKVDVNAYLTEESVREGSGTGLAILIGASTVEGQIIFDFAPNNYGPELWTSDVNELVNRAQSFDASEAATAIKAFLPAGDLSKKTASREVLAPGRPPKDWWEKHVAEVKSGNPSYSDEQVSATVGRIWSDMNKGQKEYRSRGK